MKINWELKDIYTVKSYQISANAIGSGFYQSKRFYLLPYLPVKFRDRVIFFPEVQAYAKDFRKFANIENAADLPLNIRQNIQKSYSNYIIPYEHKYKELIEYSLRIKNRFEQFCLHNFTFKIPSINIYPCFVGSLGSYIINNLQVNLYPRFDRDLQEIYALLITALTHFSLVYMRNKNKWNLTSDKDWWTKQLKAKELYSTPEFRKIFNKEVISITNILYTKNTGTLAQESADYYKRLGFDINPILEYSKQIPNLTKAESTVLDKLINNRNQIVTFDELGDILWNNSNDVNYSLYAVSKIIERIRSKIRTSGTKPNIIQAARGKGYLLYD